MIYIENLICIGKRGRNRHAGGVCEEMNNERRLGQTVAALGGN